MNTLHFVQVQQTQYVLAQTDVMAFATAALGSIEFVEPPHTAVGIIPYGQLFYKLKMKLIKPLLLLLGAHVISFHTISIFRTHITALIIIIM